MGGTGFPSSDRSLAHHRRGGKIACLPPDELAGVPRAFIRGTSISGGLEFSADLFDANGFKGTRRVIDISGDGANKNGTPVEMARDAVLARRIVINGLPLLLKPRLYLYTGGDGLADYYRDCVIGGPGAFAISVTETIQMARAIRRKLLREIAGLRPLLQLAIGHARRARVDCFIGEKIYRNWEQE